MMTIEQFKKDAAKMEELKQIAANTKQVAPYILDVQRIHVDTVSKFAKITGSACYWIANREARYFMRVSDPLCYMLEQAGMNE